MDSRELDGRLHPDLLDYARDVRRRGMAARYVGPRHRVPSRLHPNARRNVAQVFTQIGKDVAKHRVLVVSSDHDCLKSAISSPFEAVDKMCPDRSISEEKRIVHDQRGVNQGTTKFLHPPAIQPAHVQIARRILWRKVRCPNLPVVMSKKDIAGAFRLLWVAPGSSAGLQSRQSGVRAGRLLVRLANLVEMKHNCTIIAGWWRTYHNVDSDFITRCTDEEFREYVTEKQWMSGRPYGKPWRTRSVLARASFRGPPRWIGKA